MGSKITLVTHPCWTPIGGQFFGPKEDQAEQPSDPEAETHNYTTLHRDSTCPPRQHGRLSRLHHVAPSSCNHRLGAVCHIRTHMSSEAKTCNKHPTVFTSSYCTRTCLQTTCPSGYLSSLLRLQPVDVRRTLHLLSRTSEATFTCTLFGSSLFG